MTVSVQEPASARGTVAAEEPATLAIYRLMREEISGEAIDRFLEEHSFPIVERRGL